MKTNYFFRQALFVVALFCFTGGFAQVAKTPNFVEVVSPVISGVDSLGAPVKADFAFAFENAVAWGDYNNDGFLDVIIVGVGNNWAKQTFLYKNNGDGTFTKVVTPFDNLEAGNATWLDFNNDGNLDLLLCGNDDIGPYTALYKNLGAGHNFDFVQVFDGTFVYINNGGGNNANRYAVAGDYNNDGWVDIYLQGKDASGTMQSILYKNLQGKGFEAVANPINGNAPLTLLYGGTAAWGDYNNDGYLDLVVNGQIIDGAPVQVGATETQFCGVYKNNGDGTFAAPISFLGTTQGDVAWFDYNNDGKLDFLKTGVRGVYNRDVLGVDNTNAWNWSWYSDIYENDGAGGFTIIPASQNGMPGGKQQASIALGDANNDGFEDVLYMNADPNSIFLNNYGDQTFTRDTLRYGANPTFTGNQWGGSASMVDFDNDGNLDLFTAAYAFTPRLLKNQLGNGVLTNQAPSIPTNLSATADNNGVVTFTWTASTDDNTPVEAIKYNLYVKQDGNDSAKFVLPADLTTGRLKVNELLAPITKTSYKMNGLAGGHYTFGVEAIDNSKVASHFATGQFTIAGGLNAVTTVNTNNINVIARGKTITVSATEDFVGTVNVYDPSGLNVSKVSGQINGAKIELTSTGVYIVKVTSDSNSMMKKVILK